MKNCHAPPMMSDHEFYATSLTVKFFSFQCKLCSNVICSECVFNGSTQLLQGGYCRLCDEVQRINSLQILCRNAVRKYIACNLTCGHGNESRNSSPTAHINRVIDQLSLPKIVREIMKLHP